MVAVMVQDRLTLGLGSGLGSGLDLPTVRVGVGVGVSVGVTSRYSHDSHDDSWGRSQLQF